MDNKRSKLSDKPELPTKLKLENTMDASGMWFAAAVLFAVLAAGIIIYRAANDDIIRTASNDALTAPALKFAIVLAPCRQGDQITELFATVHESACGPKADILIAWANVRFWG